MSRNEWEQGTIKIPKDQYAAVRTSVISSYNQHLDKRFTLARLAYEAASKAGYRKHGFSRAKWAREHYWRVADYITKQDSHKVFLPKKKDFRHVPTSKSAVLHIGEATIAFDNRKGTVSYSVEENNHACETARRHSVVKSLFASLSRISRWTRGSGGEIFGNDEYNRDNHGSGGGTNYVTTRFGPDTRFARFAEGWAGNG